MDSPRENNDCYFYYYSTCLKGDRCQFRHELSAMNCETVCRFWQRGICQNQQCTFRHMTMGNDRKITPYYWKNQPSVLPKHHTSQHGTPWLSPPEPHPDKQESGRECITTPTHIKKRKLKKSDNKLQHFQSELTPSYAHNNTRVEPKSNTVSSRWYSNGGNDLRAQILSKAAHRNSRADADFRVMTLEEIRRNRRLREEGHCSDMEGRAIAKVKPSRDIAAAGALSANKFKSVCVAVHSGDTSESRFQAKQKNCKSHYNFQVSRSLCGDKVTVMFNTNVNSDCNSDTLLEPVRVGHTLIGAPTQIREKEKSLENDTSSCSIPKKQSLVSNRLALKQTGDGLRNVGDGKNFLVSESNRNEKDYFDQTNQMLSDTEYKPRIRQKKRKNTEPAGGSPPKRPRIVPPTADSLKVTAVTPQANGGSDLSKLDGKSYLDTGGSGCFVLGQPCTNISEDSFKSCSVLAVSSSICDKSSITSFNTAGCGAAQNIDPTSQTTSDSILALSTTSAKCVLDGKKKDISKSPAALGDTGTDELQVVHDDDITSVTLDTEEDILRQIDDILNDTFY